MASGGIVVLFAKFNVRTEESTPDKLIDEFQGLDAVPLKENTPRPVLILSFIESEKYIVP